MKRKIRDAIILFLGIGICIAPFLGMAVAKTDTTTEKRSLASFPKLQGEEGINLSFGTQLGDYFHDHFAWKNQFVSLDSLIQAKVFGTSAVDTVLVGTEDWLYYTDTLDDYLGRNPLSERGVKNLIHNLQLMQKRVEAEGAVFLFTVAPNKNSLYDAHMPYYTCVKASEDKTAELFGTMIEKTNGTVNYADLFAPFMEQKEILYRRQDSHWNEKGAALAYRVLMDELGKEHRDYTTTPYLRTRTKKGDLATALYALAAQDEWDGEYQYEKGYQFTEADMDWEDAWVQTVAKKGKGSLLMYRDSFGNTLSPLIAEDYGTASFSRENVYLLDYELEQTKPDTVLVEIVERNLDRLCRFDPEDQNAEGPPVMQALEAEPMDLGQDLDNLKASGTGAGNAVIAVDSSRIQPAYQMVYGTVDPALLSSDTEILVEVTNAGRTNLYQAFQTTGFDEALQEESDNGYLVYLNSEELQTGELSVRILLSDADGTLRVAAQEDCDYKGN